MIETTEKDVFSNVLRPQRKGSLSRNYTGPSLELIARWLEVKDAPVSLVLARLELFDQELREYLLSHPNADVEGILMSLQLRIYQIRQGDFAETFEEPNDPFNDFEKRRS